MNEIALFRGAPEKFTFCPKCHSYPFSSKDMRWLVRRSRWHAPFEWITSLIKRKPFAHCAVICDSCVKIVGYEAVPQASWNGTMVWCPNCENELVQSGDLIEDADYVTYCCSRCQFYSVWDFDAPVPLMITSGKILSIPKRR